MSELNDNTPLIANIFGITHTTTLKELQKSYYEYALLCHPDNGGCVEDMRVVQETYETAKMQLQYKDESDQKMNRLVDALEKGEFRTVHAKAPTHIPSLRDIFDEVHDQFHTVCQDTCGGDVQDTSNDDLKHCFEAYDYNNDPYATQGYGSYMLNRWKQSHNSQSPDNAQYTYTSFLDDSEPAPIIPENNIDNDEETCRKSETGGKLMSYSSTQGTIGYPVCVNTNQHIRDFTVSVPLFGARKDTQSLPRTDYRLAFDDHTEEKKQ